MSKNEPKIVTSGKLELVRDAEECPTIEEQVAVLSQRIDVIEGALVHMIQVIEEAAAPQVIVPNRAQRRAAERRKPDLG